MVDFSVMWIHQRTGPNTAISYGLGTAVFAFLLAAAAVAKVWPLLVGATVIYVGFLAARYLHARGRARAMNAALVADTRLDPREVAKEYQRLAARERLELGVERPQSPAAVPVDLEHLAQLRAKYRA